MRGGAPLLLALTAGAATIRAGAVATCADGKDDCHKCVSAVATGCLFDCDCAYCPTTGTCSASMFSICPAGWDESAATCPHPACTGAVCADPKFSVKIPSGNACCAAGSTISQNRQALGGYTCSEVQDCTVSCPPNQHKHPFATSHCSCNDGFFGPDCTKQCSKDKTCHSHGTCDTHGDCVCDSGWTMGDCSACAGLHTHTTGSGSRVKCECDTDYYKSAAQRGHEPFHAELSTGCDVQVLNQSPDNLISRGRCLRHCLCFQVLQPGHHVSWPRDLQRCRRLVR